MLQMFCYFVISRGWRYKRRGIILAFDVLLWGITFGYSMLCWRLSRHKSFCSKENSSRLLPTAGVNIAKGTRSRNQLIDFFHWTVLINYKWCTTLKLTAWIKRQVSSGKSCNSTLRYALKQKKRYYLGIFPKRRPPPFWEPLIQKNMKYAIWNMK